MIIQMALELQRLDYYISTQDLYEKPTIHELAQTASFIKNVPIRPKTKHSNLITLLPSQQFLLDSVADPNYWAIPVLFIFKNKKSRFLYPR